MRLSLKEQKALTRLGFRIQDSTVKIESLSAFRVGFDLPTDPNQARRMT